MKEADRVEFYDDLGIDATDRREAGAEVVDPVDRALKVLQKWHAKETSEATRDKVLETLKEEDKNDIVEALLKKWKIKK